MSASVSNPYVPPNSPSITIANTVFTDFANLIVLYANWTSANNSSILRKQFSGGTAGYTVPNGKTFYARAWRSINVLSFTAGGFVLAQTDTDTGWSAALSGTITYINGGTVSTADRAVYPAGTANSIQSGSCFLPFTKSGQYIGFTANTVAAGVGNSFELWGYEV